MKKTKNPKRQLPLTLQEVEEKRQIGKHWYAGILSDMSQTETNKRILSKSKIVRVSNDFISASFNSSLSEMATNVLFYSLTKIYFKDEELLPLIIDVNTFSKTLPSKRTARTSQIKKSLDELSTLEVTTDKERTRWAKVYEYILYKDYERIIYYKINDDIKHWLIKLTRNYASFNIGNIKDLTSRHSKWIYVLLKAFVGLKQRKMSLQQFYSCLGIKQDTPFRSFKPKLENAIDQINATSDINCSHALIRRGKKVEYINFRIRKKPKELIRKVRKIQAQKQARAQAEKARAKEAHPELRKMIKNYFERKLKEMKSALRIIAPISFAKGDWESAYSTAAFKVHELWETYKRDKIGGVGYQANSVEFAKIIVFPWLDNEFAKYEKLKLTSPEYAADKQEPRPTWLLTKYFKTNLKNFHGDLLRTVEEVEAEWAKKTQEKQRMMEARRKEAKKAEENEQKREETELEKFYREEFG